MGGWEVLELPAKAIERQEIPIGDGLIWTREPGDILQPERVGEAELAQFRKELGSAHFEAQYQQRPVLPGGNLVKLEWFERYDEAPACFQFEAVLQSWDTAIVPGEGNDYSVCTTWGILGKRLYLVDVFREQLIYPDLRQAVVDLKQEFDAAMVVVEKAGSGFSLYQDLRREGADWIYNLGPEGNKVSRLSHQSAKIEAGHVYLPKVAPWRVAFESEVAAFPNGKHDDQIDSLSQFLRTLDYRPLPIRSLSWYAGN
jgi:predicted phage terminase large subunit-like protein